MKKRIVSMILIAVTTFSLFGTVYADNSDKIISKMLQFTAEDRVNLFTLLKPLLITDSGIDVIVSLISSYNPNSDSMIDDMIGSMLQYVDKATAAKVVSSIKLIDESIRRKYANSYEKRETMQISANAKQDLQYFITKACNGHSGLEKLMKDDGITIEVVANLLRVIVDVNAGKPLLTDDSIGSEGIGIFTVSKTFSSKANQFLIDNSLESSSNIIYTYISKLNAQFNTDEKSKIKRIGEEIGFYTPMKEIISSDSSNGNAFQKNEVSIKYNVINDKNIFPNVDLNGATVVEVALYNNNVKQEFGKLSEVYTIKIPVLSDNIMVYKIEDSLVPVKYNVCIDNELYILIDSTGYFGITYMPKYFDDNNGWGSAYVESLYNRGILNGNESGIFAPDDNITREEFVKLIVELLGLDDDKYYTNFTDVNKDEWYFKYVAIAYKNNLISGIGDNRFGIGENILRQDICKIIANVIQIKNIKLPSQKENFVFNDNNNIDDYAKNSIDMMYKYGLVSGDENGSFNPKNNATRQEAAKIVYGILQLYVLSLMN